jgi:hypothetical protein
MANNFRSNVTPSISTSASNVYVCQSGTQSTIIGMSIANILTSTITASVVLNSGPLAVHIVKNATIGPGQSLVPVGGDQKIVLEAGDYLTVQTSDITSADVIVSALEIT